jgi:hypothetical protein
MLGYVGSLGLTNRVNHQMSMVYLIKCQIIMVNLTKGQIKMVNFTKPYPTNMVNLTKPWPFLWTFVHLD